MRPPTSFTYSVSSGASRKLGSRKRISRIACSPILRSRYGDSSAPDVSPSSGRVCACACGTNNARPRQTAGILMDNMIPLYGLGSRTRPFARTCVSLEGGEMNRSGKLSHFDGSGQAHMVTAETIGGTGVEMEALTAVSGGLLTSDDICKAGDRARIIEDIKVREKSGG